MTAYQLDSPKEIFCGYPCSLRLTGDLNASKMVGPVLSYVHHVVSRAHTHLSRAIHKCRRYQPVYEGISIRLE